MAVELGGMTLSLLTGVAVSERARVARQDVPGLAGSLTQHLGRASVEVRLDGIFYGPSAADDLQRLRDLHLGGEPLDFFTESVGQGYFSQVTVDWLEVDQRGGEPDQFNFRCLLVEYVEPPAPPSAPSLLDGLDTEILGEAASFMDGVQDAMAQVADLVSVIANAPDFGNPTARLTELPAAFNAVAEGSAAAGLTKLLEGLG